ncbi:hypothetical protein BH09SUM1_BH09SUM1_22570 [soil metagenome]
MGAVSTGLPGFKALRMLLSGALFITICALSPAAEATSGTLTVLTYNCLSSNTDFAGTQRIIEQANPDVVCLQEASPAARTFLRQKLAAKFPHFSSLGGTTTDGTITVLSRYPIRQPLVADGMWVGFINVGGREVQLANVHLSGLGKWAKTPAEMTKEFARTEEIRTTQLHKLFLRLEPNYPTIIAGDCNTLPGSNVCKLLAEKRFTDSLAFFSATVAYAPTFHLFANTPLSYGIRIDYIWRDPTIRAKSGKVIDGGASDHEAVLATLEFIGPPK